MNFLKKYWVWVVAILLIGLFLWLRFNNIRASLFFFNDMGRDLLVLYDWKETGKPPLLGPQTSALPINQSAIYFYMLMPAFLIWQGSPLVPLYTNAFLYIISFLAGLWFLREKPKLRSGLLVFFFLITISPQYIIQNRFVWNPSFTTPFLATALFSFYLLNEKFTRNRLFIFVTSLAISVSLSYSIAPVFISIFLFLIILWKKNRIKTVLAASMALIIVNLPTILFEVKHKFLLTSSLLIRGLEGQRAEDTTMATKFKSLFGYGLSLSEPWLISATLLLTILIIYCFFKGKNRELRTFSLLLSLTLIVTFLVPLTIHSHYIFGFTTLLFLSICMLPMRAKIVVLVVMAAVYLNPTRLSEYFKPARRTHSEMDQCFKQVCGEIKSPTFVSVQAGFHPYHNGPEHRFMMKMAGCDVKYIENDLNAADLMAVVLDDSDFDIEKTSYYELTMFGKAQEIKRFDCQENFGVVILKKDSLDKEFSGE